MMAQIDAHTLKAWLGDGREIALIDVSEHGQYGSGHPFFAVSLPYSRFELSLPALVLGIILLALSMAGSARASMSDAA